MSRLGSLVLGLVIILLTVTCARITVNVYFPAAELQNAATEIEREVRGTDTDPAKPAEPATPTRKPQDSSLWPRWRFVRLHLTPIPARAQSIDINITTPAIRQLIASRKQRYPRLRPFFSQGALGENNRGLVSLRALAALSLRDQARVKTLVAQENRDRQQLYQALVRANNLPPQKAADVARIFARVNQQEAQTGWWVQEDSGQWKRTK
jgi:uncharacterized protein YdbL (DUF1318 family)